MSLFCIEDESHAETLGRFSDHAGVVAELRRLAAIPWDQEPNLAPCTNWRKCGRRYEVVEYDDRVRPWTQISRCPALTISAEGVEWADAFRPWADLSAQSGAPEV